MFLQEFANQARLVKSPSISTSTHRFIPNNLINLPKTVCYLNIGFSRKQSFSYIIAITKYLYDSQINAFFRKRDSMRDTLRQNRSHILLRKDSK